MTVLNSSSLPLYMIRAMLMRLTHPHARTCRECTITTVNSSHDVWQKSIDALDELICPRNSVAQHMYYRHLPLEWFAATPEQTEDGVLLLQIDEDSYPRARAPIVQGLRRLMVREHLDVVLVCPDEDIRDLVLNDLFPWVPLHLLADAPLSDFHLVLCSLLGFEGLGTEFEMIDIEDLIHTPPGAELKLA